MRVSGALAAALVSDVMLGRQLDAERQHLDLWDMAVWAYRDQRAHVVLRGNADWYDWTVATMAPDECVRGVRVHPDAALLHAAVLELGADAARVLVACAEHGQMPVYSTAQPRLVRVENEDRGRGGAAHVVRGEWVEVAPIRLTVAEKNRASVADAPIEVRREVARSGRLEFRYQVDPRPPRRRVRGALLAGERGGRTGYGSGCRVWVAHCLVEEVPNRHYIDQVNRLFDLWHAAMTDLHRSLAGTDFTTHVLTGFAELPRPCNEDGD